MLHNSACCKVGVPAVCCAEPCLTNNVSRVPSPLTSRGASGRPHRGRPLAAAHSPRAGLATRHRAPRSVRKPRTCHAWCRLSIVTLTLISHSVRPLVTATCPRLVATAYFVSAAVQQQGAVHAWRGLVRGEGGARLPPPHMWRDVVCGMTTLVYSSLFVVGLERCGAEFSEIERAVLPFKPKRLSNRYGCRCYQHRLSCGRVVRPPHAVGTDHRGAA